MRAQRRKPSLRAGATTVVLLRLYITGRAPNSLQAIANLEAICKEHFKEGLRLEIVDVLEHPRRAMADGVLVSPSLTRVRPLPGVNLVGNLSDRANVVRALGLKRRAR
jgi:circadian clock protein KaiB